MQLCLSYESICYGSHCQQVTRVQLCFLYKSHHYCWTMFYLLAVHHMWCGSLTLTPMFYIAILWSEAHSTTVAHAWLLSG